MPAISNAARSVAEKLKLSGKVMKQGSPSAISTCVAKSRWWPSGRKLGGRRPYCWAMSSFTNRPERIRSMNPQKGKRNGLVEQKFLAPDGTDGGGRRSCFG